MKKLNLLLVFVMLFTITHAQKFTFINIDVQDKVKTVKFALIGFTDDVHKKKVYELLKADENISNLLIDKNNFCSAIVKNNIGADYIYDIISPYGIRYSSDTVIEKNIKQENLPLHYPRMTKDVGKEYDEESFLKSLEFWKQNYPNEWEEYQKNQSKNK